MNVEVQVLQGLEDSLFDSPTNQLAELTRLLALHDRHENFELLHEGVVGFLGDFEGHFSQTVEQPPNEVFVKGRNFGEVLGGAGSGKQFLEAVF